MELRYVTRKGFVTLAHTTQIVARRTDKWLSAYVVIHVIWQSSHPLIATKTPSHKCSPMLALFMTNTFDMYVV